MNGLWCAASPPCDRGHGGYRHSGYEGHSHGGHGGYYPSRPHCGTSIRFSFGR